MQGRGFFPAPLPPGEGGASRGAAPLWASPQGAQHVCLGALPVGDAVGVALEKATRGGS